MQKISILIPTRENYELLAKCLASIQQACTSKKFKYETIVLDGSDDLDFTRKLLKRAERVPNLIHADVEQWWNFSQINNYGAEIATGDYFLYLNNDCYLSPNFFEKLGPLKEDDMQGFILVHADGLTIQHAGVAFMGRPCHIGYLTRRTWYKPTLPKTYVPAVTFACALASRKIHETIKGLDTRYAFAYEDIDFCFRAWENNFTISVRNDIELIHESHANANIFGFHASSDIDKNMKLFTFLWPATRMSKVYENINKALATETPEVAEILGVTRPG